jgi:hypothetical protein
MSHDMPAMSAGWTWTFDGKAFLNFNAQERKYTDFHQIESQNWFMTGASRRVGRGSLMLHAMLSAEPWTFHQYGSAQVFQNGETYQGAELIDYQHPHDFVMMASARFEWPVDHGWRLIFAGGPVDGPALGPEAYPHRASADMNPTAPLSHHHLDSTHITHGVITMGVRKDAITFEASAFAGREPDENRVNIEFPPIDSYSARLSWQHGKWQGQVSGGHLKFPDPTEFTDIDRLTASLSYTGKFKKRPLAVSMMFGFNHATAYHVTLPAALVEGEWTVAPGHTFFTRAEVVEKDLLTAGGYDPPGFPHVTVTSTIGALTVGYARTIATMPKGRLQGQLDAGADATVYAVDPNLKPSYGQPFSAHVFLRYKFGNASPVMDMSHRP